MSSSTALDHSLVPRSSSDGALSTLDTPTSMRAVSSAYNLEDMAQRRGDREEEELLRAVFLASSMSTQSSDTSDTSSEKDVDVSDSRMKADEDHDPLMVQLTPW